MQTFILGSKSLISQDHDVTNTSHQQHATTQNAVIENRGHKLETTVDIRNVQIDTVEGVYFTGMICF